MRWIALPLALILAGCSFNAMPKEFVDIGKTAAGSMLEQAKWEELTAGLRGHVNNPGVEVQTGVLYVARARLTGVDGDVQLDGTGAGSGLTADDETRAWFREQLRRDPSNADLFIEVLREQRGGIQVEAVD